MPSDVKELSNRGTAATPWGSLPPRMRALYITTRDDTDAWLAEAFAADSASAVLLEQAIGAKAGLERLRDQAFDAVLVNHEPGVLDAIELLEGLRAGGSEEALIVLGHENEPEMSSLCFEVGADGYVCVQTTTTRTLLWTVARAIERHNLIRENRRMTQAERNRLQQEQQEATRLLDEQRALIDDLNVRRHSVPGQPEPGAEGAAGSDACERGSTHPLSESLAGHYRELLRAQVIMGSGNLSKEMRLLAELLSDTGITSAQMMELHVQALEELIRGLGNRSARHVMTRTDLLLAQILLYLTEAYRVRYLDALRPRRQLMLPGFHSPARLSEPGLAP